MEKYSLWIRSVELLAVVTVLITCVIKMRKKGFALYFKILLCATACYALFLLYDVTSGFCKMMQFVVNVGDIGVLGCGAFLFSANFGQMDGLVDERTKSSLSVRLTAFLAPVDLLALYCGLVFSSDAVLKFKILGIVPIIAGVFASYYHLKHILLPNDSLGLLKIVYPSNIFALLFLLFSTLYMGALVASYVIVEEIAEMLSVIFICVMSVYSVKEAEKWKTSI